MGQAFSGLLHRAQISSVSFQPLFTKKVPSGKKKNSQVFLFSPDKQCCSLVAGTSGTGLFVTSLKGTEHWNQQEEHFFATKYEHSCNYEFSFSRKKYLSDPQNGKTMRFTELWERWLAVLRETMASKAPGHPCSTLRSLERSGGERQPSAFILLPIIRKKATVPPPVA